jgi:dTDP-4-dehydrorhamnose 3,5-epimerase-like enzyme
MALAKQIEIHALASIKGGMAQFYTPQSSHETMLVQIPSGTIDDLFVHHFQTDQLLVVRGGFVLVVLQNRRYQYIYLHEDKPQVLRIPPGIPHGAINISDRECVLVNAVLRHGPAYEKDYRPLKRPFAYDMAQVAQAQEDALSALML